MILVWMAPFRYGGMAASIATRAISWRNRRSSPSLINRPWLINSSTTSGSSINDTSSSDCTREPIRAAISNASCAGVVNVLVRQEQHHESMPERVAAGLQHLGDEEGVTGGQAVSSVASMPCLVPVSRRRPSTALAR